MGSLHEAVLAMQDVARELRADRAAGLASAPEHVATLSAWADRRLLLSSIVPSDDVDAVASCHSLCQLAKVMPGCREHPAALQTLVTALVAGLEAMACHLEVRAGKTREQLGLFDDYSPPGGIN